MIKTTHTNEIIGSPTLADAKVMNYSKTLPFNRKKEHII
jgi:hypothetical protein